MVGGRSETLRVCVIGCGAIADEHLPFLAEDDRIDLVAVCDLSPTLAAIAQERYGADRALTDVDEALELVRPDVVHILTPPRTHPQMVRRALAAGSRVICEKPLAPTSDETRELLDLAASAGRTVVETRNVLYNDEVLRLDRELAAGRLGEVREVDVSLALELGAFDVPRGGLGMPAGVAHDYLPHLAYLLVHFAGTTLDPPTVVGWVDNRSGRPDIGFDHVDALVRIGDVRCRLRISPDVLPGSLRVNIRGTEGVVEADLYRPFVRREGPPWTGKLSPFGLAAEGADLIGASVRLIGNRLVQHGTYHGMPRMLDAVYGALLAGREAPVTPIQMIASAQLIDAVVALIGDRP